MTILSFSFLYRRHVLKFMMSGPLGYHVHLCSSTQFVFGDEETVMSQLTKVSQTFIFCLDL